MTDRINALIVVLEDSIRVDDAEPLMAAIRQLRGVAAVGVNVADHDSYIAYSLARAKLVEQLYAALAPKF